MRRRCITLPGRLASPRQNQRDKISVLISPFYQADEPVPGTGGNPAWVIYAAAGGGVLFLVLLLVILLLSRRRRKRRKELEAAGLAAVAGGDRSAHAAGGRIL